VLTYTEPITSKRETDNKGERQRDRNKDKFETFSFSVQTLGSANPEFP